MAAGTDITNDGAVPYDENQNNVCQLTGFKVGPGTLLKQWDGLWVRPESFSRRNTQDFVRTKAELLTGATRPEPIDNFISTSIAPEDL